MYNKINKSFLFFVLILLFSQSLNAQIRVTGTIIDEATGDGLEGVKVILKSSNVKGGGFFSGVLTEENGDFDVTTSFRFPLDLIVFLAIVLIFALPAGINRKKIFVEGDAFTTRMKKQ